jgi:hypothetical protein
MQCASQTADLLSYAISICYEPDDFPVALICALISMLIFYENLPRLRHASFKSLGTNDLIRYLFSP